jgi:hypothetical protein
MCTVSYIPIKNGYILTSNRDEDPSRSTISPQKQRLSNGETILAPIDGQQRGTWIATNTRNKTASLPYKRSRGHYVIETFMYHAFSSFVEKVDLDNIEPFTLIFIEDAEPQVLIWDGNEKHYTALDKNIPKLWSSSTLYTEEEHHKKEIFFNASLKKGNMDKTSILKVHGWKEETPFILNKPHVKTVSIVQIVSKNNEITLDYYPKN